MSMMTKMKKQMHPNSAWRRKRIRSSTGRFRAPRLMVSLAVVGSVYVNYLLLSLTLSLATLTSPPKDNEMSGDDGTALMRPVSVRDGDTVGVAVQQSDLPMIQFLLNGEPIHEIAINRFRGSVFPAIYVREGIKAEVVFDEDNFKELSPHARFGPLIAARGII